MENKEIYIDGVDVSGCEFYYKDDKTCKEVNGRYDTDICDFDKCEGSNCYYKQLKRSEAQCEAMFVTHTDLEKAYKAKEQECERLRNNLRCAWKSLEGTLCPEAQEQLDQLKAENKELIRKNANKRTSLKKKQLHITQLKAELEQEKALKETYLACYKAKHEDIEGKLFKLKQTLTEIKEIAETCMEINDCTKYILQKISECEMENE